MEVRVAKSAGFCSGVRRAVELAYGQADSDGPLYTYGPIIHNAQVVADLERKGVRLIEPGAPLDGLPRGRVVIRSHGISRAEQERLARAGFEVLDATCHFVKMIHRIVAEHSAEGERIAIVGDPSHPEVEGIRGWCDPERTVVIEDEDGARRLSLPDGEKLCVVSQSTFNADKFEKIVEIIRNKGYYDRVCILNTICNATGKRQAEARSLARASDAMLVVGDAKSSNTQKLFEICKDECKDTYYIQTPEDLDLTELHRFGIVGITAGASTPNYIIEEVQKYVRNEL